MSTLTTINAGDNISTSRTDINNNFSNLNADKVETTVLDTDTTLAANSDLKVATQKAVKAYVDTGGNSNASEAVRGIVEEATDAEVTAGTATGATGAKLVVTPAKLATRLSTVAPNIQTFTSSGTWTKPAGARFVSVFGIGGGAPGAASGTTNPPQGGGGGGGGAFGAYYNNADLITATVTVTVATGAVSASASTFGSYLSVAGGVTGLTLGGAGGAGGAAGSNGIAGGAGGTGGGNNQGGGGGGGGGGSVGATGAAGGAGGAGGTATSASGGAGGAGGATGGVVGAVGVTYGGGGGGGGGSINTNILGGNGASGLFVVVTYF